jgi:hypothetical protein
MMISLNKSVTVTVGSSFWRNFAMSSGGLGGIAIPLALATLSRASPMNLPIAGTAFFGGKGSSETVISSVGLFRGTSGLTDEEEMCEGREDRRVSKIAGSWLGGEMLFLAVLAS